MEIIKSHYGIQDWQGYENGNVYPVSQLADFLEEACSFDNFELVSSDSCSYYNAPCSFDIETTSFIDNGEKRATMWIWQFGLNGSVIYGRTWEEFMDLCAELVNYLNLETSKTHLIIYVHNLSFEFQFIRRLFSWDKVFFIKDRRPVQCIAVGLEFRCSYFLSNYSLKYLGDNLLLRYPIRKLMGDLDYSKPRHSQTPVSSKELGYCINDVKVVMSYIQEKIEQEGGIDKIPLTNTGYVRNYCRQRCFYEDSSDPKERKTIRATYHKLMQALRIHDKEEYYQLNRAFMGGFTHTSLLWAGQIIRESQYGHIESEDIASSYPFCMVTDYFPMSDATLIGPIYDNDAFYYYLKNFCCIFDIEFVNILPSVDFDHVISVHKCSFPDGIDSYDENNGRVIRASRLITTITELDFDIIRRFYHWDSIRVTNFRIYERGYLPRALILAILDLYEKKTSLKDVPGREIEYMVSKNMINSVYGMMVTAIIRNEIVYDTLTDTWHPNTSIDHETLIQKYNNNINRFQFYPWGVYVTAHARHHLFDAIWYLGPDYIYSDTDSVKFINGDTHEQFFTEYNNKVIAKLVRTSLRLEIPLSKFMPKTPKGVQKPLGVFSREPGYSIFKADGAKRYIYKESDTGLYRLTVSGISKAYAMPYLLYTKTNASSYNPDCEIMLSQLSIEPDPSVPPFIQIARLAYGSSEHGETVEISRSIQRKCASFISSLDIIEGFIFMDFGEGLFIPAEYTGKLNSGYIDFATAGVIYDYLGHPATYHEESSLNLSPESYLMHMTQEYRDLLEEHYDASF